MIYPSRAQGLKEFGNEDVFDDLIAVWSDYFNKKFSTTAPLDVDTVKALLASESGFEIDPKSNKTVIGIAQITRATLKLLQNPEGEAKDFIFKKIRIKDLKDPNIAIPLAIRWLFRKKELAKAKLKREPSSEEIILEYKGLLKSSTTFKENALKKYRKFYEKLKKK